MRKSLLNGGLKLCIIFAATNANGKRKLIKLGGIMELKVETNITLERAAAQRLSRNFHPWAVASEL